MDSANIEWKNTLNNVKSFYLEHGFFPKRDENNSLAQWIARQRLLYKKGSLSKERMNIIKNEFPEILKSDQQKKYEEKLLKVAEHLSVDSFDSLEADLKKWLYHQRDSYRKGTLSDEILDKINKIIPNFLDSTSSFGKDEETWRNTLFDIKSYYNKNNCLPKQGTSFRIWINNQRQLFRKDKLNTHRTKLIMKTLPLILDLTHEKNSITSLQKELISYYINHGNVPPLNTKIGVWFYNKVRLYKRGELSRELIEFFEENKIPLLTKSEVSWENSFQLVKEHYEKFQELPKEKKLKQWIALNKKKYKDETLSKDKIDRIKESFPPLFINDNRKWLANLKKEKIFFIENNRIRNSAESRWIRNLKKEIANNTLCSWQLIEIEDSIPQLLKKEQ